MRQMVYRFTFEPEVEMEVVESALTISTIATEAIYGESAMMTDGKFALNKRPRICLIDARTQLGRDLAKVFAGFLNNYSGGCFRTEMIHSKEPLGDLLDFCGTLI